jgi:hypothetical protein
MHTRIDPVCHLAGSAEANRRRDQSASFDQHTRARVDRLGIAHAGQFHFALEMADMDFASVRLDDPPRQRGGVAILRACCGVALDPFGHWHKIFETKRRTTC